MKKSSRKKVIALFLSILAINLSMVAQNSNLNVLDCGAIGDGITINTVVIQKAIDSVNVLGGGTVYFPAGEWMTGKIFLKSNITLDISPKATILAAPGPIYGQPEGSITSLI